MERILKKVGGIELYNTTPLTKLAWTKKIGVGNTQDMHNVLSNLTQVSSYLRVMIDA